MIVKTEKYTTEEIETVTKKFFEEKENIETQLQDLIEFMNQDIQEGDSRKVSIENYWTLAEALSVAEVTLELLVERLKDQGF